MPPGPVVVGSVASLPDAVRRFILFDMEDDAAADPVRLDEPDRYLVADPKDPTRPPADQPLSISLALVVVAQVDTGTSPWAPFSAEVTNSPNSATPLMWPVKTLPIDRDSSVAR